LGTLFGIFASSGISKCCDPADCATLETPKIFVKCKRTIAIYSLLFLPLSPYDFFFHIKITSKSLMLHAWSQQF
jgi:hypothetical protein